MLTRVERYLDAAPRPHAKTEDIGGFTLFVSTGAFDYYARPGLGSGGGFSADGIASVRRRQADLGVPERFEWTDESAPELAKLLLQAGMRVERRPLLVLDRPLTLAPPDGVVIDFLEADSPGLDQAVAAVDVGFRAGGTGTGEEGVTARDALVPSLGPERLDHFRTLIRAGLLSWATATDGDGSGIIGGGSHAPREVGGALIAELTGIGVLPAMRRRGVGGALTAALVADALARDAALVFLSATDDTVARVYERAGFRRIGTACEATPRE